MQLPAPHCRAYPASHTQQLQQPSSKPNERREYLCVFQTYRPNSNVQNPLAGAEPRRTVISITAVLASPVNVTAFHTERLRFTKIAAALSQRNLAPSFDHQPDRAAQFKRKRKEKDKANLV
ncbi:hypothetical protein MHYP_G00180340 [Metynnis hypsauchen]